jgi:hypothetical protein
VEETYHHYIIVVFDDSNEKTVYFVCTNEPIDPFPPRDGREWEAHSIEPCLGPSCPIRGQSVVLQRHEN